MVFPVLWTKHIELLSCKPTVTAILNSSSLFGSVSDPSHFDVDPDPDPDPGIHIW